MGKREWKWHIEFGAVLHAAVAIVAMLCAVEVWPSDLAWGLFAIACVSVLFMAPWSFELNFDGHDAGPRRPDDTRQPGEF